VRAVKHARPFRLYSSSPSRYMSAAAVTELSSKSVKSAMTRYQLLLLPTLAAAILVLGGALNTKPPAPQPPVPVSSAATNDPQALAILDNAIAALAPERLSWMETKVWQQARCEDFAYQASGRLLTAPGDRMRFDLNVKVGKTVGEMRMVNDGKRLWRSIRMGAENAAVQSWDWPVLNDALKTHAEVAQARAQLMKDRGVAGLPLMLRTLRQGMQSAQVRQQSWHGNTTYIISAAWPENAATPGSMFDVAPPRFHLRQCLIYLDAESSWPCRIEWWGAEKPNKPNELLTQTEFRKPVLNQPLSAERCAGEFTVAAN
jgi:hypothetical protein